MRPPILHLLPATLAFALLAAHFVRAGLVPLAPACLGAVALLFVRLPWVRYLVAGSLLLAAAEWCRTLVVFLGERMDAGLPYLRLVLILGAVVLATLLAILPFRSAVLRRWYVGEDQRRG
jgi:hypothetical protein